MSDNSWRFPDGVVHTHDNTGYRTDKPDDYVAAHKDCTPMHKDLVDMVEEETRKLLEEAVTPGLMNGIQFGGWTREQLIDHLVKALIVG